MEPNQENTSAKQKQILKIIFVILLVALPLVYLYYRSNNEQSVENIPLQTNTPSAASDIAGMENAVKTNPSFDNLVNLSMAYINNQMPGKSIDYLLKAIQMNPNSSIAYNNLGVAYTMMAQYQNGVDACTKALQIDTSFQLAKNNLKWATDERNKVLAAIAQQELVDPSKRDVNFYIDYGLNYFKINNYDKSIEIWNKVFDLDPKNTSALNNIGTAFMMKNQTDDAIALFRKALELDPNDQLAKNNLAWGLDVKSKKEPSLNK